MNEKLRNKITGMSVEELQNIIDNKADYEADVFEYVQGILQVESGSDEAVKETKENCSDNKLNTKSDNFGTYLIRRYNTLIIAFVVCVIVAITMAVGISVYNNRKMQINNAIARVNSLCDEINSTDISSEVSKLHLLDVKLSEIYTLIEANNLDKMYTQKYTESKNYTDDLKTYSEINKALEMNDDDCWLKIQDNINALKTDGIKSKINDAVLERIQYTVENRLIFNTLKYYEQYIAYKNQLNSSISGVTESFYYYVPDGDHNFLMSVPDNTNIENVCVIGFGDVESNNKAIAINAVAQPYRPLASSAIKDSIRNKEKGGFAVEYVNNELNDMINYCPYTYDIEVKYAENNLKIILKTNDGNEELSMHEIRSKKLINFAE